jgi:phosphatidylglycerophosphatase A
MINQPLLNFQFSMNKIKMIVGSSCGLGYVPLMPGTFGALPGILFYFLLWTFLPEQYLVHGLLVVIALLILLTYLLTPWAIEYWKSEDPSEFVLDEVIGFLCVPVFFPQHDFFQTALYGFILFRVLDIIKVPPANIVDKNVKGWFGIVFDDVISAGYAALVLYTMEYYNILF